MRLGFQPPPVKEESVEGRADAYKLPLQMKGTGFTGCGKTRFGGRRGFQPPHKANRVNAGFTGCGKTRSGAQEASGHDISRAVSLAESIRASAPAVCFSGISAVFGPFSAAWTGGAEATGNWVHGVATAIACGLFLCDEVQFSFGMAPNWRYKL